MPGDFLGQVVHPRPDVLHRGVAEALPGLAHGQDADGEAKRLSILISLEMKVSEMRG